MLYLMDINHRTLQKFDPAEGCDEPLDDGTQLSECCGAPPASSMVNDIAICSECGEWAEFNN